MNSRLVISAIGSLLVGGIIYLLFRDPSLIFFGWIDEIGFLNELKSLQGQARSMKNALPNWILFSLPDGLWLFSYVCFMLHFWRKKLRWSGLIWALILPVGAIIFEIIQAIDPSLGTFDWVDFLLYICGSVFPFAVFKKSINFNSNSIVKS